MTIYSKKETDGSIKKLTERVLEVEKEKSDLKTEFS